MARSLDIGTMFLVKGETDEVTDQSAFTIERNSFLQVASGSDNEDVLKENNWSYVQYGDNYYVLGEDALKLKNLLTLKAKPEDRNIIVAQVGDLRRPMKDGILNISDEKLSVGIIQQLIKKLLGKPSRPHEHLCFCAPGDPVDNSLSTIVHKTMLTGFLKGLGYEVECIPEALAIIFSERPCAEDPDEGEIPFTGVSVSCGAGMMNICMAFKKMPLINFSVARCIPSGNKVITKLGFKDIEFVTVNDEVLNMHGQWTNVIDASVKPYSGDIYQFESIGMGSWSTTYDHRLWIKRDKKWQWIEAQNVIKGDMVKQPWPEYDRFEHCIGWTDKRTKEYKHIPVQSKQFYILGRFLGDGSIIRDRSGDRGIEICCNINDTRIDYLKSMMESVFSTHVEKVERENDNVVELKIHNTGIGKWFRNNCYNDKKEKLFPWDISNLCENYLRFLLAGLLHSDGYVDATKNRISLGITSPSAAQLGYLAMLKLGLKPTVSWRFRNDEHQYKNKTIKSTKEIFEVGCAGERCKYFIQWLNSDNLVLCYDKSETEGCGVGQITDITTVKCDCDVYDISVNDSSSSFCVPGCVLHNCGDWIDQETARTVGVDVSAITKFKESKFDLSNVDMSDTQQAVLSIYYEEMIKHGLNNLAEKFNQLDNRIESPLEVVVAGGTATVPGFVNKFVEVISSIELPFNIKKVRLAENPLYTVSNGCLIKAISTENKLAGKSDEKGEKIKAKKPSG